jgi:glycosyltransferase involved in cell wall biosynthesis
MKKKIIVRAPALTQSGYGEQSRFALRALRSREDIFDIYLHPIKWGKTGWLPKDTEEREWLDSLVKKAAAFEANRGQYDVSLQITIPNEWGRMAPVNIGYTAGIETTRISTQWVEKSMEMDRIIVISEHAKYGFEKTSYQATNQKTGETISDFKCQTPVDVVNYAVRDISPQKVDLKLDYDFNFLSVAQWGLRKNLENTIAWFVEEFKDDEVGLVLKILYTNNCLMDKQKCRDNLKMLLSRFPDRKCKIYLLHGDMSEEEMTGLYQNPKIKGLINLAHGEGFGLPMFEAAQHALPVIAPSWGGQLDFLYIPTKDKKRKNKVHNKPHYAAVEYVLQPVPEQAVWENVLIKDSMWCYPHQGNYKSKIRDVYESYGTYKKMAKTLQKHILNKFSQENQYKQFVDSCLAVCGYVEDQEVNNIFEKMLAGQK